MRSDVDFTQIATAARALGLNVPEALLATAAEAIANRRNGASASQHPYIAFVRNGSARRPHRAPFRESLASPGSRT
jgi:hypothetical protein